MWTVQTKETSRNTNLAMEAKQNEKVAYVREGARSGNPTKQGGCFPQSLQASLYRKSGGHAHHDRIKLPKINASVPAIATFSSKCLFEL